MASSFLGRECFFVVPGAPVPKARVRTVVHAGRTMSFTPKKTRAYEKAVKTIAAAAWPHGPTGHPIKLALTFYCHNKVRRDIDNLCKSVLDPLNGIVYVDDSQIFYLLAQKFVDRTHPRVDIQITEVVSDPAATL